MVSDLLKESGPAGSVEEPGRVDSATSHPQVDLLKSLSSDCGRLRAEKKELEGSVNSLRKKQQSLQARNKRLRQSCDKLEANYQALDADCKKVRELTLTIEQEYETKRKKLEGRYAEERRRIFDSAIAEISRAQEALAQAKQRATERKATPLATDHPSLPKDNCFFAAFFGGPDPFQSGSGSRSTFK